MVKGNSQKLPSLDGWRAVSIGLVLLAHATFTPGFPTLLNPIVLGWFGTGPMGVRFFFVISGFLITWLMLKEHEHCGRIFVRNFYLRRVLRIFPVYFLYLLILGGFTHYSQSPSNWLGNVTFTTNFFRNPHPTEHLWSLAVEEQFYLLWPWFLIGLLNCQDGRSKLLRVLILPIVVAPTVRLMFSKQWYPSSLYFLFQGWSFFSTFDTLAFGCGAAILFADARSSLELFFKRNFHGIALGGTLLILAPTALRLLHFPGRLQAFSFDTLQAIGFSLLLLQSILYPGRGFYRFLNWRWVGHIGVLSYSIYIWQQMFCGTDETVFGVKNAWWTSFPIWMLVALLVAHASYYLFEKPFFKLRAKFRDA